MNYKNVELFNVEEIHYTPDKSGVALYRFPFDVIDAIKGRGAFISRSNTGCEIRFVTNANVIWLTMEAVREDAEITVFLGDIVYEKHTLKAGVKTTLQLQKNNVFGNVEEEILKKLGKRFPVSLWRIYINNENSHCILYDVNGLDGFVRPPMDNEVPKKKWLAYGSSITHGCWTADTSNSYIQVAARLLDVDVMCKGMAGGCMCEREMANYIKDADWDFATLELGVNMYGIKTKEFKKRVQYMIGTVHEANPGRKVFVITPFPNINSFGLDKDRFDKNIDYCKILKETVEEANSENVILINGNEILTDNSYLCYDLVHPSEYGHERMGENLYRRLKDLI
ncbi:MAG: SGNH/GDSL hydrolase family protein [Clostridia bacterium]|nr:SGNH/GDSL hydrolase family protein [Clostridia bacterium]